LDSVFFFPFPLVQGSPILFFQNPPPFSCHRTVNLPPYAWSLSLLSRVPSSAYTSHGPILSLPPFITPCSLFCRGPSPGPNPLGAFSFFFKLGIGFTHVSFLFPKLSFLCLLRFFYLLVFPPLKGATQGTLPPRNLSPFCFFCRSTFHVLSLLCAEMRSAGPPLFFRFMPNSPPSPFFDPELINCT